MRISWRLRNRLLVMADRVMARKPDEIIGIAGNPYMYRWVAWKSRFLRIYVHRILRSDDDRALHDHISFNASIVLFGGYTEQLRRRRERRSVCDVVLRWPTTPHRLVIERPVTTIFMLGPKLRNWGFHCDHGWVPWQEFVRDDQGCGTP